MKARRLNNTLGGDNDEQKGDRNTSDREAEEVWDKNIQSLPGLTTQSATQVTATQARNLPEVF